MLRWLLALCIIAALCLVVAWVEQLIAEARQARAQQAWQAERAEDDLVALLAVADGLRPTPFRP
ncbi:hypothetical protein ACFXAF_25845 [Kitasatospora sp. NPDC059463]|uniref:hypothetical protein n=1 Tax=unclassified Kitasatospora TaxID=2633591 RepID=UPI0036C41989